jgi:type 1 fimbria pilin
MSVFRSVLKLMISSLLMTVSAYTWAEENIDIKIAVKGEVFAETCAVKDVLVDLGKHSTQELAEEGSETEEKPFKIEISGCPSVLKTIDMEFGNKAQADPEDGTAFLNSGTAKHVSIVVFDEEEDETIQPGGTRTFILNASGSAAKNVRAWIQSVNGSATAGKVAVTVPLIFIYP